MEIDRYIGLAFVTGFSVVFIVGLMLRVIFG